jgi:hypothetical protein
MPDMQATRVRVTNIPPALQQRHCCCCSQQVHNMYATLCTAAVLHMLHGTHCSCSCEDDSLQHSLYVCM